MPVDQKALPCAYKSFGSDIFIKVPLYRARVKYRVVYINKDLFKKIFKDDNLSFVHMSNVIENKFSTTIDKEKSTGRKIGEAFIDMQEDPLNIALSGNLGSGRAFYQDGIFNIKGEKTPLAVSTRPEYATGILEFEKSVYETLTSNALCEDAAIKLSPILAILDMGEKCQVDWKDRDCVRAKIIRVDTDGSLNRITHVFKAKKKLTQKDLKTFAMNVGALEGEKFIQRIVHGAWSAGNISLDGAMIDFDTVSSVKFRAPQYSFCPWYIENYFGFEHLGQLKILKSMAPKSYQNLSKMLISAREDYIIRNFCVLMGLSFVPVTAALKSVVRQFMKLSVKCYPIFEDLSTKKMAFFSCGPFDFSKFFRFYPILKNRGLFDPLKAMDLLVAPIKDFKPFDLRQFDTSTFEDKFYFNHVLKKMDKHLIHDLDELLFYSKECLQFIEKYDRLFERYSKQKFIEEKKAYVFNEDRDTLTMVKSIGGPIDDDKKKMSAYEIHRTIEASILANKRSSDVSNMRVFKNGCFFTRHNNKGQHQLCLKIYGAVRKGRFSIKVDGDLYDVTTSFNDDVVVLESPFFDNLNLISYKQICFIYNGRKIAMKPFVFNFTVKKTIDNFA